MDAELAELAGILRFGSTLSLADYVSEALAEAGLTGVSVIWEYAEPATGLAHGARWTQFTDGAWYCLADRLWEFLAASGPMPEDITERGPDYGDKVGDAVPGTRHSYFAG